jgi:hypothetical protein
VGICIATCYSHSGFIGELIVRPEARSRGVGAALLNQGVQSLKDRGGESVYLDGVVKAVGLYEHNGFVKVCRSWRFLGRLPGKRCSDARRMNINDLDQVLSLDRSSFGGDRNFFIRRCLELFPNFCYVQVNNTGVIGFILGREHADRIYAGPWVVHNDAYDPLNLLNAFALEAGNRPIKIGILDTNTRSCDLVRSLGFVEQSDSPWRMVFGRSHILGASPHCYAIGSAAKG